MTQTQTLVRARLPECLVTITIEYFGRSTNVTEAASLGQWEFCRDHADQAPNCALIFEAACIDGYIAILELTTYYAINCNIGLCTASRYGQFEVVNHLISRGANCFNSALNNACYGESSSIGHTGNYGKIIKLLIGHGATHCYFCGESATHHLSVLKN